MRDLLKADQGTLHCIFMNESVECIQGYIFPRSSSPYVLCAVAVCVHRPAGLLLHPQPGGEEHAEGGGGGGDRHGEGAQRAGPHRHQEGTHRHQGEQNTTDQRFPNVFLDP